MPRKMRLSTRPKVALFIQAIGATFLSTLLFANASAAALGKLTVSSALGQPLQAEIDLTSVTDDEAALLKPKLASVEAFRQANIDFNPALLSLRFAVVQHDGKQYIRITSIQPINDPFVDMLLELNSDGNNRLVREYTFLLDPVDMRAAQAPVVAAAPAPVPLERRSSQDALPIQAEAPANDRPVHSKEPQTPLKSRINPVASQLTVPEKHVPQQGSYRVKKGDSLSKIAGQFKPDGMSLDQMLVSMFRVNQGAFVGNNMNRLRAGQVLSVPDADSTGSISNGEARNIVVAQAADFNDYRNKLAGRVANAAPQKPSEIKQNASGKITAKVEEKSTVAAESKDKLKLSKAGVAASEKGGKIMPGEEDRIAKEKALAESDARVKELEKNVGDLQKILEIKNKNIAAQQKADAAKAAAKPAAPIAAPAVAAPAQTPVPAPTPVVKPVPDVNTQPAVVVPPPKPKPRVILPPSHEPSLLDDLLGNPFALGGIAILLGGGALGIYRSRRRRKAKPDSILSASNTTEGSLFGGARGQGVDTDNSVFNSNFAPTASQSDSNEVNPVAEADVYIAYGRDAQAEDILKDALRIHPDRHAVRVKLLEIYANRRDVRSFEVLAAELYGFTRGEGENWQQAASLGMSIDPQNPLYATGKILTDDRAEALPGAPAQSLDEQDVDASIADAHTGPSLEYPDTVDKSSYSGSATPALDEQPDTAHPSHSDEVARDASTSLDFDLGVDVEHVEMPEVIEPAVTAAASGNTGNMIDFGDIDFDSMKQETQTEPVEPVLPVAHPIEHQVDGAENLPMPIAAVLQPELEPPRLPETPTIAPDEAPANTPVTPVAQPALLDFDLTGITLELNPPEDLSPPAELTGDMKVPPPDLYVPDSHAAAEVESPAEVELLPEMPDLIPNLPAEGEVELDTGIDYEYSNSAEMATKLDLAIAYQEIGDKEGARELLEEVINGGTPDQLEKAKLLMLKLG